MIASDITTSDIATAVSDELQRKFAEYNIPIIYDCDETFYYICAWQYCVMGNRRRAAIEIRIHDTRAIVYTASPDKGPHITDSRVNSVYWSTDTTAHRQVFEYHSPTAFDDICALIDFPTVLTRYPPFDA